MVWIVVTVSSRRWLVVIVTRVGDNGHWSVYHPDRERGIGIQPVIQSEIDQLVS